MNDSYSPENGLREVQTELARLESQPVSPGELAKAQNQVLRALILDRESSESRAEELGYDAVVLGDAELVNTEPARFLAVTPSDIERVAKQYFTPENGTIVEVFPESGAAPESATGKEKHQ